MLLLLGIFDFARVCWLASSLQFAVAQGARYVMNTPAGSCGTSGNQSCKPTGANCTGSAWDSAKYISDITSYMQTQLANASLPSALPTASDPAPVLNCSASPPALTVTVKASYTFTFIWGDLLGWFPVGIPLQQRATVTAPIRRCRNAVRALSRRRIASEPPPCVARN